VQAHGHPRSPADAQHLPFVGSDRNGHYLGYLRQHGLQLGEANFSCYSDHTVAHWALVRQGMGIGAMMVEIAKQTPDMVEVLNDVPPVRFPMWLVSHRELRTSRRIRVVFEALAEGLAVEH
jgi:DNA-binding transcriptional LysR family regulator